MIACVFFIFFCPTELIKNQRLSLLSKLKNPFVDPVFPFNRRYGLTRSYMTQLGTGAKEFLSASEASNVFSQKWLLSPGESFRAFWSARLLFRLTPRSKLFMCWEVGAQTWCVCIIATCVCFVCRTIKWISVKLTCISAQRLKKKCWRGPYV